MRAEQSECVRLRMRSTASVEMAEARETSDSRCCKICHVSKNVLIRDVNAERTTWAKTRCRKTCRTAAGSGKTALTICASWLTVVRISLNSAAMPGSDLGAGESGSPIAFQLGNVSGELGGRQDEASTHMSEAVPSPPSTGLFAFSASSRTRSFEMKKSCWLT